MTELREKINNLVEDHQECLILAKSVGSSEIYEKSLNLVVASSTEPVGEDRKKIWIKRNKNLLSTFIRGSYWDNNYGRIASYSIFVRTDYVPIKVGQQYILSHDSSYNITGIQAHFFDQSMKHVDYQYCHDITVPFATNVESAKYVLINFPHGNQEDLTWIQMEKGTVATKYEPYTSTQAAYIKNDNDVYEQITNSLIIDL